MIRKIATSFLYRLPFLIPLFLKGRGIIFMLHRVLPEGERNKYTLNRTLAITPEGLEKWILKFKRKGFDIISMDEVERRLKSGNKKFFIAFTMDDGYKDNLTYGVPVFEKLNIPVTIYVANCFPEFKAVYWWYFLEDYLNKNSSIDLNFIGIQYRRTYEKKDLAKVYFEVRELLRKANYESHFKFADKICGIKNLNELNLKHNLTWDEVKELSNKSLVTIGGHTFHHVSLSNQSISIASWEIKESTIELNKKLGKEVRHFAYPYGSKDDFKKQLFDVLREAGYETAVINHPGSIFKNKVKDDMFAIPRIGLSDETKDQRIEDLISGKLHLQFNGLKKSML